MKLKIKLPLLFLLLFLLMLVLIASFLVLYMNSLAIDGHMWLGNIFRPLHFQMFLFLTILLGLIVGALIVYFHFNITKPIQLLNRMLTKVNIRKSRISLRSSRKDEIGQLYNHFNEMEERLYQAHKEQVDMIAAIAHDLKTPLTTITGFVELLSMQKNLSESERLEHYELILKKSKHMTELIDSFATFTKDELVLETIEMKPVAANRLFENIASEYEAELAGLDYELIWSHSFSPVLCVKINEQIIRRVFGNLFSNAVRHGETKDIKVYMSGFTDGHYAYFQLEDNGKGVPDMDLSALFHKFFTVDTSRQSRSGGTGLGLANCKSIIEHHGGEICAFHSGYGGLGIRFSLPFLI